MDSVDSRRVVRGHGVKGRRREIELEALKNPTILAYAKFNKTFPILGHTPYVHSMCDGATLIKKWPFSRHETCRKNIYVQYASCLDEHMKACMLKVHMAIMGSQFFSKN
jgi:hypothetical protein